MSVNKVILLGNLGKDPELVQNASTPICRFTLATNERRKDQSGNWGDHTEWHTIVTFGNTAENCAKFLKKGRQVFIDGRLSTRKWQDKEGRDRYTTEIVANSVQFVGSRGEYGGAGASGYGGGAGEGSGSGFGDGSGFGGGAAEGGGPGFGSSRPASGSAAPEMTFDDDDIPF